jgi:GxxExxY protein
MITERCDDITYRVIGAAMRVHNALGPGLKESAYQKGLSLEFENAGLRFQAEHPVDIVLDGVSIGLLYLDHLVEEKVVVEEKAVSHPLTNDEVAQVITYLCATGNSVGLLLNFGRQRLEYKRIFPPQKTDLWRTRIHRYVWNPVGSVSVNSLPIR